MIAGWLRPFALLTVMIGFGLRLETAWQRVGAACVIAGGVAGVVGLLLRRADIPANEPAQPHEAFAAHDKAR